jgi:hypothetical protein
MKPKDAIAGKWISIDEVNTVEIRVTKKERSYSVKVIDAFFDGEIAAVSEEKYDRKSGVLSFAAYWESTGRFTRYRLRAAYADKVEITYTHTDSEVLIRK